MEKLHFKATEIENGINEFNILVLGFYEENHYLVIQMTLPPDFDSLPSFMKTYHIERDDQSYGNYGGVGQIILNRQQLKLIPDANGQSHLQCTEIVVDIELDDEHFLKLQDSLTKIFKDAFRLV